MPRPVPVLLPACLVGAVLASATISPAHDVAAEMTHAAAALLATLSGEQRAKAVIAFGDEERLNWHYVPRARRGLPLKEMTPEQRLLTHALLASGLSSRGYTKTTSIMSLDAVLAVVEHNPVRRDPDNYYLTIFGQPGTADQPWAWRFEGHHVALNFTITGAEAVATTPHFFGANPATVRTEPRTGFRALAAEEDLGRALVTSLGEAQRLQAVIAAAAPREIFNEPGRNDTRPEGIAWSALDAAQRDRLLAIVHEYVERFRPELAADDLRRLEAAGWDTLHFAWAGPLEPGAPHYYRVQSGSFVLEYDNVQNGANHIHTVWRDFTHEFGADVLAEHHRTAHAN